MGKPDLSYLASLVDPIRKGDMNAFTELYAATCQKQYAFALGFLGNAFDARAALEELYITAMKTIPRLRDDSLVVACLNQANFVACLKKRAARDDPEQKDPFTNRFSIDKRTYSVRRVLELPYTESQSLLLTGYCGMKTRDAAALLELSAGALRHYIANGKERLLAGGEFNR